MNQVMTFEQRVRARINEVAADLIPAGDLEDMVRSQVAHFRHHDLPGMIKTAIRDEFARALNVELAKPEYRPMISDAGRKWLARQSVRSSQRMLVK